jgi:tetratricopeptide (TPR) repeat protein
MASTSSKIILILVVLVALLGVGAAGVYFNTPELVAARALANMWEDFTERDEVKPIKETLSGGSVAFEMGEFTEDGDTYFADGELSGKVYFSSPSTSKLPIANTDKKNAIMVKDLNFKYGDVKLSGEAYTDDTTFYVSETEYFKDAYGVNLNTIAEELAKSIFAPTSGSDYALDTETYDKLMSALEAIGDNNQFAKDAKELAEVVLKDIEKIIVENAEIESEFTKERLDGEKKDVRVIIITVGEEDIANMIMDVYEYLCNDEKIPEFLDKYEDIFMIAEDLYDTDMYDSLGEAYEEKLEKSEDDIEEYCDDIEMDEDFEIKIVTPRFSAKLLKLEISYDNDKILTIDCGEKGIKNTDKITVKLYDATFCYEIVEDTDSAFEAVITLKPYDGEKVDITFMIDKENSSYQINLIDTYTYYDYQYDVYGSYTGTEEKTSVDEWYVNGNWITDGDTISFTIGKVANKWNGGIYETDFSNLKITLDRSDEMPAPLTEFKSVADVTEADIDNIIKQIEELDGAF